jgi:hypothetical protein
MKEIKMAFTSFSGPVRAGTVQNTTGTTVGLINNTGVVVLSQTANLGLTTSAPIVLPAGSQILNIFIDVTTTFTTSATLAVGDGTTADKYVTAITTPAAGRQTITFTSAQLTAISNIGTTDVAITITMAGTTATAGAGFITVGYAQKTSLGAENPVSA